MHAPLFLGVTSFSLSSEDRLRLSHPAVGGVILFSRNYHDRKQLRELCEAIHQLKEPQLLIGVDQEGGRVQRFRDEFSPLPALGEIGALYDQDASAALKHAYAVGLIMGSELKSVDIDLSFAPVLDLQGVSTVIGSRAFHADPQVVAELGSAMVKGMHHAGLLAVGKHFPGHGSVINDTHHATAIDERTFQSLAQADLLPFRALVEEKIFGLMAAHVIYQKIDDIPAGFSHKWLKVILREQLGFQGKIFSDDLGMMAAKALGEAPVLVQAALTAGCDYVLLCNDFESMDQVLTQRPLQS